MNVRNYIQFVRINHPFVFNAKLLTVMIVPCRKKNKWKKDKVQINKAFVQVFVKDNKFFFNYLNDITVYIALL